MADDGVVDETWRWLPLSERLSERPTYHDVLFEQPAGPVLEALDVWIADALASGAGGKRYAERVNVIAGRPVVRASPGTVGGGRAGRLDSADPLDVADLLIHLLDEQVLDTGVRPHRNQGSSGAFDLMTRLTQLLRDGRSAWCVGRLPDQSFGLVRRVDAVSTQRAATVMGDDTIATGHLRRAWAYLYQRDPQPAHALDESIEALESAGRSLILPNDSLATLGKMITALRGKPEKWIVALGTVEQLADRLAAIWTRQPRHGVDDPNDVRDVSTELADAAVHEAITLVQWFRSGAVGRAGTSSSERSEPPAPG